MAPVGMKGAFRKSHAFAATAPRRLRAPYDSLATPSQPLHSRGVPERDGRIQPPRILPAPQVGGVLQLLRQLLGRGLHVRARLEVELPAYAWCTLEREDDHPDIGDRIAGGDGHLAHVLPGDGR